jgi:hypothetical protein
MKILAERFVLADGAGPLLVLEHEHVAFREVQPALL